MTEEHSPDTNPYRPPSHASLSGVTGVPSYSPGTVAAWASMGLLWLSFALSLVATGLKLWLFAEVHAGEDARVVWSRAQAVSLFSVLLMLVTGGFFAAWFHRKHKNLPTLGARDLRFSPRWASGAFFFPVLNLWRPYQVGVEIWNASDPARSPADPHGWKSLGTPHVIATWWALFLGVRIIDNVLGHLMESDREFFQVGVLLSAVVELAWAGAALYTVRLIRQLDRRQEARFEIVQASAHAVGMAPEQWVTQVEAPADIPQVHRCPSCGESYNPDDYNPNVEHIYCAICRSELPRARLT